MIAVDMDYIEADDTKEINGVYYPDWGDGKKVQISFDWEPFLVSVSDGETSEYALLRPEDYGAKAENALYSVLGIYTFTESGESRLASMLFDNAGEMLTVIGFTETTGGAAPREIIPYEGDTFTLLDEMMQVGENGEVEFYPEEGPTLTFGTKRFRWEEKPAPTGEYFVGFIAEDLDGNQYEDRVSIIVE